MCIIPQTLLTRDNHRCRLKLQLTIDPLQQLDRMSSLFTRFASSITKEGRACFEQAHLRDSINISSTQRDQLSSVVHPRRRSAAKVLSSSVQTHSADGESIFQPSGSSTHAETIVGPSVPPRTHSTSLLPPAGYAGSNVQLPARPIPRFMHSNPDLRQVQPQTR